MISETDINSLRKKISSAKEEKAALESEFKVKTASLDKVKQDINTRLEEYKLSSKTLEDAISNLKKEIVDEFDKISKEIAEVVIDV